VICRQLDCSSSDFARAWARLRRAAKRLEVGDARAACRRFLNELGWIVAGVKARAIRTLADLPDLPAGDNPRSRIVVARLGTYKDSR
jgi:hypothetical protein